MVDEGIVWEGYWYGPEDDIPKEQPGFESTGAVLVPTNAKQGRIEATCLGWNWKEEDVKGRWDVVRVKSAYTYSHSSCIIREEPHLFVMYSDGEERRIYRAFTSSNNPPLEQEDPFRILLTPITESEIAAL
jgi:hypothetical protein